MRPRRRCNSDRHHHKPKNQDICPRSTNKSRSPSDSIWSKEIAQAMLSAPGGKGGKKTKKNGRDTKKVIKCDSNDKDKAETKSTQDKREQLVNDQCFDVPQEIEIEEKKIDLRVKPAFLNPKSPHSQGEQFNFDLLSTESKESVRMDKASPIFKAKGEFSKARKLKDTIEEEIKRENIPPETVSSFYQCEPMSEEFAFVKSRSENYHRGYQRHYRNEPHRSYNSKMSHHSGYMDEGGQYSDYYQSYEGYNSYYSDYDNMHYGTSEQGLMKNQSEPLPVPDPIETRQIQCEQILYEKLSAEIEEQAKIITKNVEMIKDFRFDIKNVLEEIAIETFYSSHADVQGNIYGSVATGLALPESDMDIVITGVNSYGDRETHQSNISILFDNILSKFDDKTLIKTLKILETQVPIIKLTFSLQDYYNERVKQGNCTLPSLSFDSIGTVDENLKYLSVDISICDSYFNTGHQGIQQVYFVNHILQQFPILRPICLMLKKLLVINKCNDPYKGGLGSFSLFLMLYAAYFIEKCNSADQFQSENAYSARLFAWFLSYFGEYFDIETTCIMFMQESLPMALPKICCGLDTSKNSKLCVIDPFNSKNNTTQRAFMIDEIQRVFREAKDRIYKEFYKIYQSEDLTKLEIEVLDKILEQPCA